MAAKKPRKRDIEDEQRIRGRLRDDGVRPNAGKKLPHGRRSKEEIQANLQRPNRGNRAAHKLRQSHWEAVQYYMQGFDKKTSLLKAGYSQFYSTTKQWKVFDREDVQHAIREERWRMKSRRHKLSDKVLDEMTNLAFFNMGKILRITEEGDLIYDFSTVSEDDLAAIGEVTVEVYKEGRGPDAVNVKRVKVKPYDKKGALDSLARILGMFEDNLNVNHSGQTLEERLQAGRRRLSQISENVVDAEYQEVGTRVSDDASEGFDRATGEDVGYDGSFGDLEDDEDVEED